MTSTPNDRRFAVYLVLGTFAVLAIGLYALIGAMVYNGHAVPGELWQAAGAATGVLSGVLVSTKLSSDTGSGQTTNVVAQTANVATPEPVVEEEWIEGEPADLERRG